jgi:hypothetical protein
MYVCEGCAKMSPTPAPALRCVLSQAVHFLCMSLSVLCPCGDVTADSLQQNALYEQQVLQQHDTTWG